MNTSRLGERLHQLAFCLLALPAIARACWRLARLDRFPSPDRSPPNTANASHEGHAGSIDSSVGARRRLDELADALRRVRPPLRPRSLRNPLWLAACVGRLEPVLPPYRYGACLKSSLLLLDLWSRCGLEPVLHLGMRRADGEPRFHAWLEVDGGPSTPRRGHTVLWSG
ncbi:MAG: lasso peptide biosynthesis B2 protein [Acidobacteriota bacterium]